MSDSAAFHLLALRQCHSLHKKFALSARLASPGALRICCSLTTSTGSAALSIGDGYANSGPHAGQASDLTHRAISLVPSPLC